MKKADGLYYCPDDKHLRPAIELDRLNAVSMANIRVLPRKDPQESVNVNIYQDVEAELFKAVVQFAPYRYADITGGGNPATVGTRSVLTAAESIRALYNIVTENKRPLTWRTQAKSIMETLADWLLTAQFGSPTATGDYVQASTTMVYGAFFHDGTTAFDVAPITIYSEEVAAGGLAMILAYVTLTTVLSRGKYLTGARNAATCLRRMQCGDKRTARYTTKSDQGTDRYHVGMWTYSMTATFGVA